VCKNADFLSKVKRYLFISDIYYIMLPEWLLTTLTTGLTAALGVAGKYAWDYMMEKRVLRQTRIAKLEKLRGLLNESNGLFRMQNKLVCRLALDIQSRIDPSVSLTATVNGYESFFVKNYDTFTESEKDNHAMIRATTLNSINRVNDEMLKWMEDSLDFKSNTIRCLKKTCGKELGGALSQLELHLNLWQDKFAIWMKNEKHCVVYLADEEHHGVGFPKGIADLVDRAIIDLKDSAPFKTPNQTTAPFG
jgi:hypothetical protein